MSQPPTPTPLSPTDQDALVKQIGLALMRTAPDDWQQIAAEFRATGRYYELSADVTDSDGNGHAWTASHDIAMNFAKLRAGMYREGRGTWFNARYQIERPSSYNLEFDRQEPTWRTPPPPAAFRDELHFFPRSEDNVPDWLLRKLSGLPPERPGRRFRLARIFDGTAPNGRPSVNRPQVPEDDRDRLLEYLDHSALALPERGHDVDRLSADGRPTVPVAFHTDGMWVWPAAVNYYLRRYGVPPDPELVNHARSNGFRPPEVDEPTRVAAAATITGGRPPGPAGPPRPPGPGGPNGPGGAAVPAGPGGPPASLNGPGRPAERQQSVAANAAPPAPPVERPAPAANPVPVPSMAGAVGATDLSSGPTTALPVPGAAAAATSLVAPVREREQAPIAVATEEPQPAHSLAEELQDEVRTPEPPVQPTPPAPEVPAVPSMRGGSQQERTVNLLNKRLADLRVPEHMYRIGEPAPQTWYLEQVDEGWQVGWFDGEFSSPMLFEEVADAAAFLLGKLLLGVPAESALQDNNVASVGLPSNRPDDRLAEHDADARLDDEDTQTREPAPEPRLEQQPEPVVDTHEDVAPEPQPMAQLPMTQPPPAQQPPQQPAVQPPLQPAVQSAVQSTLPPPPMPPISPQIPPPVAQPQSHALAEMTNGSPSPLINAQPPRPNDRPNDRAPEPVPERPAAPPAPTDWPIQPLAGEPPLTLFRGKRLLELQPGTEVDRFGSPEGNLTYVAGTPFEQRSLVPEWVHRPYHMYRVIRPVQALTGGAIPWFEQPGGGTAYLLPRAVEELVNAGDLVEIEPAEPPAG